MSHVIAHLTLQELGLGAALFLAGAVFGALLFGHLRRAPRRR